MPAITRSSSNRQQNNTNTNSTNNPGAVAALPLTTPNVPTVPVPPMAPKAKKLSLDSESKSSEFGYCCICCDDIQCEKGRFVLDCGHTFHGNCILRSFKHNNRCPMCRAQVDAAAESSLDYLFPTALRINSSIISAAADHFINDMGNITVANVIHRMLLMSSDNPDMRSIQIPYIKRILVQFATVFITGIAFSVRDGERDMQEPVPIDIVNDENPLRSEDEYDAAISNPAIDAAVSYESIISADMNFDVSQPDNVGAILLRRAIALSELGSQRADLGNRRAARADARRQQMRMVQQHLRNEMLRRQAIAEQQPEQQNVDANSHDETVIMEEQQEQENPWGPQF
jgi:hypothetical protein